MRQPGMAAWAVGVLVLTAAGCGQRAEEEASVSVRDSAGVAIVESRAPTWGEEEALFVGSEPQLRVGVVEGERPYQLSEVAGVLRLDDGGVVVADGATREVRFYASDGSFLRAAGRQGEGPGEFASLTSLGRAGERIWAYDFGTRRVTWLDRAGRIVETVRLGPEPAVLHPVGALADGSTILRQLWGTADGDVGEGGKSRAPVAFVSFDAGGELVDTLAVIPGREVFLREEDGRGVMMTPLVGRNAVGTVWSRAGASGPPGGYDGATVVVGDQTTFELRELSPGGEVVRVLRIPGRDLSLHADEVERMAERWVESVPEPARPGLRAMLESQPVPERKPAYGGLLADGAGRLWVSEWARSPDLPERWTVLGADGAWLGDVTMPDDFYPYDAGEGWIAGVETDEMGIEYAVVYPLERGSRVRQ